MTDILTFVCLPLDELGGRGGDPQWSPPEHDGKRRSQHRGPVPRPEPRRPRVLRPWSPTPEELKVRGRRHEEREGLWAFKGGAELSQAFTGAWWREPGSVRWRRQRTEQELGDESAKSHMCVVGRVVTPINCGSGGMFLLNCPYVPTVGCGLRGELLYLCGKIMTMDMNLQ